MKLVADYRGPGGPVPLRGCVAPARGGEQIVVSDGAGGVLLRTLSPPFVTAATAERYESVAERMVGVDLRVEWRVRRWPTRTEGRWLQVFRDGVEVADGDAGSAADADIAVSCEYRDFARFLLGAALITDAAAPVRIEHGGVAELSCLVGLVLTEPTLRSVALPAPLRRLLAAALVDL